MKLTPEVTLVICVLVISVTVLAALHAVDSHVIDLMFTALISGVTGALAPGTIQSVKQSMRPPPMSREKDDL